MEYEEKENKEIELRSEEVQEIMNEIPPWILRCGISTLFVIVMALLIGSWLFKYPDVLKAKIIVSSLEPPESIISQSTGKIDEIFVRNNQTVTKGTPLAVIQNSARTKDVITLIKTMRTWKQSNYSKDMMKELFVGKPFSLGSIQSAYASFLNSLNDYQNYKTLNYYSQKIALKKLQLATQEEYNNNLIKQITISKQFVSKKSNFKQNYTPISNKMFSDNKYNISQSNFMQKKQLYFSFKVLIKESKLQLMRIKENLLDLQQKTTKLGQKYQLSLLNATEVLNTQIKVWEQNYLLVSPINGTVNQMGFWSKNQNINTGEIVFTIIPPQQNTPKGKAMLPIQGAGKVKIGQSVNIRINNFPDQEFGYLLGKVESISSIPTKEGFYILEISFPNGMQTNYGKTLPMTQQVLGNADIITEDLRLIERIFMPIKKYLKQ